MCSITVMEAIEEYRTYNRTQNYSPASVTPSYRNLEEFARWLAEQGGATAWPTWASRMRVHWWSTCRNVRTAPGRAPASPPLPYALRRAHSFSSSSASVASTSNPSGKGGRGGSPMPSRTRGCW